MSQSGSPRRSPPNAEICVGENTTSNDDGLLNSSDIVSRDQTGPDSDNRERVIKEVGLTSEVFIGPCFPPPAAAAGKSDLEKELSDFYKELETPDDDSDAHVNSGTQKDVVLPPAHQQTTEQNQNVPQKTTNVGREFSETDGYWKKSGKKGLSWPHWHQNEPYHLKRPTQSHNQQPMKSPASLGPQRPPFQCPPPPYAFPNPQTQAPSQVNPTWSDPFPPSRGLQEAQTQRFGFHSPHEHYPYREDHYDNHQQDLNRDGHGYGYNKYPDDRNIDWLRPKEGEGPQFDEDHDRRQERVQRNDLYDPWGPRPHPPPDNSHPQRSSLVLILMRGLPGSGKTTLARELVSTGPSGLILSTDDYFGQGKDYHYDPGLLGAAHEWNQRRAKHAMDDHRSPIIIDNTNIEAWEMKPYVKMALEKGYRVDFCEPDTRWKFDPCELGRRNKHGVHQEKIAQMRKRFVFPISVDIVLSSEEPRHVTRRHRPNQR